jgi:hypothetical protein
VLLEEFGEREHGSVMGDVEGCLGAFGRHQGAAVFADEPADMSCVTAARSAGSVNCSQVRSARGAVRTRCTTRAVLASSGRRLFRAAAAFVVADGGVAGGEGEGVVAVAAKRRAGVRQARFEVLGGG